MNYISYSGWKLYVQCPFAYWHNYVNKTRTATPDNGLNTLYGSTVGLVFEAFYRDEIWRHRDYLKRLLDLVEPSLEFAIREQIQRGRRIDWGDEKANYHSRSEVIADARESIPKGVQTIQENRLIGPQAKAEVKLDSRFRGYILGGRADFVILRVQPLSDLVILDGKGSKHREKYLEGKPAKEGAVIEGTQLKWYALLYREQHKVVPDGLGYLFWRFDGKKAIEWVPFTERDLIQLRDEALANLSRIDTSEKRLLAVSGKRQAYEDLRQELFPAQPGYGCNLCAYVSVCEEGQKKVKTAKKARVALPTGVDGLALGLEDE
jgi:hypothetical protein